MLFQDAGGVARAKLFMESLNSMNVQNISLAITIKHRCQSPLQPCTTWIEITFTFTLIITGNQSPLRRIRPLGAPSLCFLQSPPQIRSCVIDHGMIPPSRQIYGFHFVCGKHSRFGRFRGTNLDVWPQKLRFDRLVGRELTLHYANRQAIRWRGRVDEHCR